MMHIEDCRNNIWNVRKYNKQERAEIIGYYRYSRWLWHYFKVAFNNQKTSVDWLLKRYKTIGIPDEYKT